MVIKCRVVLPVRTVTDWQCYFGLGCKDKVCSMMLPVGTVIGCHWSRRQCCFGPGCARRS